MKMQNSVKIKYIANNNNSKYNHLIQFNNKHNINSLNKYNNKLNLTKTI